MFDRRILLVLGSVALIAGVALSALWLKAPRETAPVVSDVPDRAIMVVARSLKAQALLRVDDLDWKSLPAKEIPVGAYVRGAATANDVAGAVLRRDMLAGDFVTAQKIVKSNEPGFLAAVLGLGMRAIAIAVGPAEGAAGLIVPGDRVDVVLTQDLSEADPARGRRLVGETVLTNLRVIAIDQTITTDSKSRPIESRVNAPGDSRVAKTVTLEVSPAQAEALMVASQLGKIQLTLRNANEENSPVSAGPGEGGPTWGHDVSPALRGLSRNPPPVRGQQPSPTTAPPTGSSIEILHGPQVERRCFDDANRVTTICPPTPPAGAPAPAAASPTTLPSGGAQAPSPVGRRL